MGWVSCIRTEYGCPVYGLNMVAQDMVPNFFLYCVGGIVGIEWGY